MKVIFLCFFLMDSISLLAQCQYIAQGYDHAIYYLAGNTEIKITQISSASSLEGYLWKNDSIDIFVKDGAGYLKKICFFNPSLKDLQKKKPVRQFKRAFIADINNAALTQDSLTVKLVKYSWKGKQDSFVKRSLNWTAFIYELTTNSLLAVTEYGHIFLFREQKVVWEKRKKASGAFMGLAGRLDQGLMESIRFSDDNKIIYIEAQYRAFSLKTSFHLVELDLYDGNRKIIAKHEQIANAYYSDDNKYIYYSSSHKNVNWVYQYDRISKKTEQKYVFYNQKKILLSRMFEIN